MDEFEYMTEDDAWGEYEASGARADYESALEDGEAVSERHRGLADLSELRRVRRGRYGSDVELAKTQADTAVQALHRGEPEEFDPDAVARAETAVEVLTNSVNRALRETVDEILQVLADVLDVALGLPTGPTAQISGYAQPPPKTTDPRRRPAMPRAPATTASYQARGVLRAVA